MRLVGKIKDAHGLRGELYVLVFSGDLSWLPRLKEFGLGECPMPGTEPSSDQPVSSKLKVEKVKPFKKGFILKPVEISDRTAAEKLLKMGFYIPEELLQSNEGEGIYLEEILDFTVKDSKDKTVGKITDFSSNSAQDILVVKTEGGATAEIPFVDAFIVKIDFKKRIVKMDIPDGLLELGLTKE